MKTNDYDGTYLGFKYKIQNEKDGEGFPRYTTLVKVNGQWKDAVPCALWYSGSNWKREMGNFISRQSQTGVAHAMTDAPADLKFL